MSGRKRLKQEISSLSSFCPHGEAIAKLRPDLRVAVNILNNLPADYHRPNTHMSPEQLAWHTDVERKARASRREED